jgi:hypothetical protein
MVMGSKYGNCPMRILNQGFFDHWPNALTNCVNRANILPNMAMQSEKA